MSKKGRVKQDLEETSRRRPIAVSHSSSARALTQVGWCKQLRPCGTNLAYSQRWRRFPRSPLPTRIASPAPVCGRTPWLRPQSRVEVPRARAL